MTARATFSLFVRRLPPTRNVLLACGIDDVVDLVAGLRFDAAALAALRAFGEFPEPFLDWLARFRFSGDIDAVAEGTPVCFAPGSFQALTDPQSNATNHPASKAPDPGDIISERPGDFIGIRIHAIKHGWSPRNV
jgi:nicotinate phosphoribosyltransferase